MSEFAQVVSRDELSMLNDDEMVAGYMAGLAGDDEPGSAYSRSFWHGWRNGMVDGGFAGCDESQRRIAKDVVQRHMKMH